MEKSLTCIELHKKLKEQLRGENVLIKICKDKITVFINEGRKIKFEKVLPTMNTSYLTICAMARVIVFEYKKFVQEQYYGRETIKWI